MNAQLYLLQKHNLLIPFQNLLLSVLPSTLYSSHEIEPLVFSSTVYQQIRTLLRRYPPCGFSEPTSFIGSACSDLANHGKCKRGKKTCSYKNCDVDAFKK